MLKASVGAEFQEQIKNIVRVATKLMDKFSDNTGELRKFVRQLKLAVKFILVLKAGMFISQKFLIAYKATLGAVSFAITAYTKGLNAAIAAHKVLNTTVKANIFGAVTAAVIFLTEKVIRWRKETKKQLDVVKDVKEETEKIENSIARQQLNKFLKEMGLISKQGGISILDYSPEKLDELEKRLGGLTFSALEMAKGFFETQIKDQERLIKNIKKEGKALGTPEQVTRNRLQAPLSSLKAYGLIMEKINQEFKQGITDMGKKGDELGFGTTVRTGAPRIFNINIDKLVEQLNITPQTLREGTSEVKDVIIETLLDGLNEFQLTTQ